MYAITQKVSFPGCTASLAELMEPFMCRIFFVGYNDVNRLCPEALDVIKRFGLDQIGLLKFLLKKWLKTKSKRGSSISPRVIQRVPKDSLLIPTPRVCSSTVHKIVPNLAEKPAAFTEGRNTQVVVIRTVEIGLDFYEAQIPHTSALEDDVEDGRAHICADMQCLQVGTAMSTTGKARGGRSKRCLADAFATNTPHTPADQMAGPAHYARALKHRQEMYDAMEVARKEVDSDAAVVVALSTAPHDTSIVGSVLHRPAEDTVVSVRMMMTWSEQPSVSIQRREGAGVGFYLPLSHLPWDSACTWTSILCDLTASFQDIETLCVLVEDETGASLVCTASGLRAVYGGDAAEFNFTDGEFRFSRLGLDNKRLVGLGVACVSEKQHAASWYFQHALAYLGAEKAAEVVWVEAAVRHSLTVAREEHELTIPLNMFQPLPERTALVLPNLHERVICWTSGRSWLLLCHRLNDMDDVDLYTSRSQQHGFCRVGKSPLRTLVSEGLQASMRQAVAYLS